MRSIRRSDWATQTTGGANGGLTVTKRIPREARARQQVLGASIVLLIRRGSRIAGEDQPRRRGQYGTRVRRSIDSACHEVGVTEELDVIVGVALRQIWLKTQPEIDSQV